MAKFTAPKIAQRVKVSILPSSDATEEVELDYRLLIAGNFSKKEQGEHALELKNRKPYEIKSKRDFKKALETIKPQLKLNVPNRLSGDPKDLLEVELNITDMKDFHPDEISKNVKPLEELRQARDRLKNLKLAVQKDPKLRVAIEDALKDVKDGKSSIEDLMGKLATGEAKS